MIDDLMLPGTADSRSAAGAWIDATSRSRRALDARALVPFALAGLSGAGFAAAFPPLSWPIAAWISLAPLLVACAALPPLGAAMAGMCWTAAAAAGVASFLPTMLSGYFGLAGVPSAVAALAIVGGLHGLAISGYAAWVSWLVRRRAANPILLAGGWMVCEFARAHGPLGSPWALAAYSQIGWTAMIQSADLAGPYAIGALVAAVNACAAAWLVPALGGRRPVAATAATACALAAALLYGQFRLGESFDAGPAVRVAVVQGGATPARRADRAARLERYVELTRNYAAPDTSLIVWPEYAVEAYLEEASPARAAVLGVAGEARADLVLGGPHYESSAAGTRYHNSAYLIRGGRLAARYDKHRLVPFAEDDRIVSILGRAPSGYAAGRGDLVLQGSALRLGPLLCVEAMYPDFVRRAVERGAEALVNLSNDAWFGASAPALQQLQIATLRAVENRRYLVRAAATGFSAVIDPHGRTLVQSEFDTFQVLNATVRAAHARTPYQRWGDAFAWIVFAGVAAATLRSLLERTSLHNLEEVRMKRSHTLVALACCFAVGSARPARAGAPQPDTRQGDFAHVCQGGANKALPCTVANEATDCPKSECVVRTLSKSIRGRLTIVAHDAVTDWLNGGATNQALTVMLEVKAPDGSRQMLAATYQDLATPANPPQAAGNVVAIGMDEFAVQTLAGAVGGLLFVQPEPTMSQKLQELFNVTGTPVIVAASEGRVDSADHTADGLATVLRFKVKVQFVEPV